MGVVGGNDSLTAALTKAREVREMAIEDYLPMIPFMNKDGEEMSVEERRALAFAAWVGAYTPPSKAKSACSAME